MPNLTIKEKYAKVDLSKLPDNFKKEFQAIKDDSGNFDPDLVEYFEDVFNTLYSLTEKKYPDAIKKGGTLKKVAPATKKVIKPKAKVEEKKFVPKSRGKKPKQFVAKSRGKKPATEPNHIEECQKVLKEAGYSYKKKLSKDGKKAMKVKAPRPERTIITEKVDDTFKTILKDVSGSEEKDKKYKAMQSSLSELQSLMTKLFNRLNNLAEDNSTEKVNSIIALLKKIVE